MEILSQGIASCMHACMAIYLGSDDKLLFTRSFTGKQEDIL